MVAHIAHHHRRQLTDPVAAPTADGLNGATTIDTNAVASTLAFDATNTGAGPVGTAPPLVLSSVPVIRSTVSTESSPEPTAAAAAGANNKLIPMSTVVGACLGALSGAVILILIGLWFYKRSEPRRRARQPHPLSASRNAKGDLARTRSGMETWKKLGDDEDKWETKYQTKEIYPSETVGPMEKLTMFKSPSIRTAYTHRSEEHPTFDLEPHPFASYHPGLAKDMASNTDQPEKEPEATPRQFLGRVDVGPALSWDSQGSFLTYQSRLSGSMSPLPGIAKSTPNVTSSEPHTWESAEVLDFNEVANEVAIAHSNNPFREESERRRSNGNNPFFSSGSLSSPSPNMKSSPQAAIPEIVTPKIDKGKARDMTGSDANPFSDRNTPVAPAFPTDVVSIAPSISSSDRALQSLIAALDIPAEEVQERLRVASMQPSIISNVSGYTTGGEDDVTEAFPIPPGQSFITP